MSTGTLQQSRCESREVMDFTKVKLTKHEVAAKVSCV